MNDSTELQDAEPIAGLQLPDGFDYDLFVKGTLATLTSLFSENRMNSASESNVDAAVTNAVMVGLRFEKAMRPYKRAAGRKPK